jgi:hypothetical protein
MMVRVQDAADRKGRSLEHQMKSLAAAVAGHWGVDELG